jgi:hypothetical protein
MVDPKDEGLWNMQPKRKPEKRLKNSRIPNSRDECFSYGKIKRLPVAEVVLMALEDAVKIDRPSMSRMNLSCETT